MPRVVSEVKVGTGTLYHAPTGTAFPADPTAAPAAAWIDIGYSDSGWTFAIDRNWEDIEVAEEMDPIDVLMTKRSIELRAVVAQVSLDNLQIAMGGATITTITGPPAYKKLVPLAADAAPVKKALLLRVDAPTGAGKKRDIQMPEGISAGAIEIPHAKAPDKRLLGITFRIVKPTTGDIFSVLDAT